MIASAREASVYFIGTACGRYVKIGSSKNPEMQLSRLSKQARIYFDTDILKFIGIVFAENAHEAEGAFQRRFAAYLLKREWFEVRGELLEFVESHKFDVPGAQLELGHDPTHVYCPALPAAAHPA